MLSFKDELFRDRESIMSTSYYFFRQQSNYYSRGSDVNSQGSEKRMCCKIVGIASAYFVWDSTKLVTS
jgi:hypothetical protein